MNYNIEEHRHRFAAWAAARAVQRGFTNTSNIISAIENTNLQEIVTNKSLWPKCNDDFNKLHKIWCDKVISKLNNLGIKTSYGRAAKIVAIYLKSTIVLSGNEKTKFGRIIHPPIDRILLSALKIKQNWTKLDKKSYFKLIKELESRNQNIAFWQIEEYWQPKKT